MSDVLKLILEGEALSTQQMAAILGQSTEAIEAEFSRLQAEKTLLGWRPILNPDLDDGQVRAVIEVRISPEREGGFDKIANRIARFDRVESCYLMSGAYDLLVVLRAPHLRRIAQFVFEKLATIEGVQSTATHFMLRAYKESGYLVPQPETEESKPAVSP